MDGFDYKSIANKSTARWCCGGAVRDQFVKMGGWIVDMIQLPFRNHKHACFVNIHTDHDPWHSCLAPSDETTDVDCDPTWR